MESEEGGGEVGQERTLPRDLTLPLPLPNSTFRGKVVPAAIWAAIWRLERNHQMPPRVRQMSAAGSRGNRKSQVEPMNH